MKPAQHNHKTVERSLTIPRSLYDDVRRIAVVEARTVSGMMRILLAEAVSTRKENK